MIVMTTVIYRNLGVRYNLAFNYGRYDPQRLPQFVSARNPDRSRRHVRDDAGVVCRIGRRLGYPIKLVLAKDHCFCRWDGPDGERFNVEATSPGFNSMPDEHYRTWPKPITELELNNGWYLRNLAPREELAFFLQQRGTCCLDNFLTLRVEAFCYARRLTPDYPGYHEDWGLALFVHRAGMEAFKRQHSLKAPLASPRIPKPVEPWEHRVYQLACDELQRVISNREWKHEAALHQEVFEEMAVPA